MRKTIARSCAVAGILFAATMAVSQADNLKDIEITDEFPWERCAAYFVNYCDGLECNPYLPLIPGRVQVLDNSECDDCEEFEAVHVTMLEDVDDGRELVNGHWTRVMEEREFVEEFGEEPAEVSRNFVIMCPNTQDVFYFGEDVCLHEDDEDALEEPLYGGHYDCEAIDMLYGTGAWRAGLGDDEPGLLFPGGTFLLNAAYFQELASVALDWGLNEEAGVSEAGFEDCVVVLDRNLLEDPKSKEEGDEKIYCPDIGLVKDEDLELVSCTDIGDVDCEQ